MRMRKKDWARPELAACSYYTDQPETLKGHWQEHFARKQPLHLDLGCGKCTFLAELAFRHPEINYIGIDQSPDVLGVARRNIESTFSAGEKTVDNVMLTAYDIEKIAAILDENQEKVSRIYINFCNPWPKARHHKRRLTHRIQLMKYRKLLCENGELWFKTDNDDLFLSTLRYLEEAGFEITDKTFDQRHLFSCTLFSIEPYAQILTGRRQGFSLILILLIGVLKIGIGRVYDIQTAFPVVVTHISGI